MAVNLVDMYAPGVPSDPVQHDEDFERRRREARAQLAAAMKQRPIQHWTQGLAQMGDAALAGYDDYRARADAKEQRAAMADIMGKMWGNQGIGGATGPAVPKAAQAQQAATPAAAPLTSPNSGSIPRDIKEQFTGGAGSGDQGIPLDQAYNTNLPSIPQPLPSPVATGDDAYLAQQPPVPPMPTVPNPLSNFNGVGRWAEPAVQPARPPMPMASAPEMSPNMGAMPPDLSARVLSPSMMAQSKGLISLGAPPTGVTPMPPLTGVMIQPPAQPEAVTPAPFSINDLTGGRMRGPGGQRDPSGISRIIAHDATGDITPENLAKYSQTTKGYHYAVDRNTGDTYRLQNPSAVAYHTKGHSNGTNLDDTSLAVAMTGNEGEPVSDKARAAMAQLLAKLQADHKISPDNISRHPSMQSGKNPKEADWLPSVMAYSAPAAGAAAAQIDDQGQGVNFANLAQPAAALGAAPDQPSPATGLIQMAQQGGAAVTPELFKSLALRDPKMAQQLLMQEIQRQQPDYQLKQDLTRSEINKNNAQAGVAGGKVDYGTTPPGYHRFTGPDGRMRMEQIPGAPADEKTVQRMQGDERTMSYTQQQLNELQLAAKEVRDHPGLAGNTGIKGKFPNMPGSDAANAQAKLDTLKSKVGFSTLQTMRDASKTGGALGSVTEGEHKLLQNTLDSLDKAQSYEAMQESLNNIMRQTEESKSRIKYHFDRAYGGRANEQAHPNDSRTQFQGQGYAQPSQGGDPFAGQFSRPRITAGLGHSTG